jgi:hypothetical protein
MKILLLLSLAGIAAAQTTRNVDLSWTASATAGVIGYNVFRCTAPCTPSVTLTPLNGSTPVSSLSFVDATAVVGTTYTYGVTAVAAACTPTTPTSAVCGQSIPSTPSTTTVPLQPAVTVSVTISVP